MCNNNPCKCGTKTIDWAKPLRFGNNGEFKVEVIGQGHYGAQHVAVKMYHPKRPENVYYSLFDRTTGKCVEAISSESQYNYVENIPEPPRNCILLVKDGPKGDWRIHTYDKWNGKPLFTEAEANKHLEGYKKYYDAVVVTVPNTKG